MTGFFRTKMHCCTRSVLALFRFMFSTELRNDTKAKEMEKIEANSPASSARRALAS